jgi:hypothetical protein
MSVLRVVGAALDRALLKKLFANVPVGLKLLGGPINGSSASIFQMSIQQSPRFGEYFQIWPGAADNEVEVLSHDAALRQLVLRVKEPRRPYLERFRSWLSSADRGRARAEAYAQTAGGRVLREQRDSWLLEMWTPSVERRYLCGMDDLHLFIAEIREGDTVAEAHESLKPELVRAAEAIAPGCVQRQGEWFFVPPTDEESRRLSAHLKSWPGALALDWPVGPGRRPHVAGGVVAIDRRVRSEHREYRRPEVYARGLVLHPDHRPLRVETWRRVVRNREIPGPPIADPKRRVRWID